MSGTASIGKCNADHRPPPSSATAASRTKARWRRENSRMRSIMLPFLFFLRLTDLNGVEIQPRQPLQFLSGLQRLAPRIEQRLDRFQVLLLQLDVSGDGHRAEPVVTVGQLRCFAKLIDRFGPPFSYLGEVPLVRQRCLDDAPVEVALPDVERR